MVEITAAMVKELCERTGLGMMGCEKVLTAAGGDIEKAIDDMRAVGMIKVAKKADNIAAEGSIVVKITADNKATVVIEVNSQTDLLALQDDFKGFAAESLEKASNEKLIDAAPPVEAREEARLALVTKTGENVNIRRLTRVEGDVAGAYLYGHRTDIVANLKGGNPELVKDIAMHVATSNPQSSSASEVSEEAITKEKETLLSLNTDKIAGKPENIVENMVKGRISKSLAEASLVEQPFVKSSEVKVGDLAKRTGAEVVSFVRYEMSEGIERAEVNLAAEVATQVAATEQQQRRLQLSPRKGLPADVRGLLVKWGSVRGSFRAADLFGGFARNVGIKSPPPTTARPSRTSIAAGEKVVVQQLSVRQPRHKRILLKLSGEVLMGSEEFGIDPKVLDRMALGIGQLVGIGVQVDLVIGGSNLSRGAALSVAGMDRVTGDHMGMLATVMNGLVMRDALERSNTPALMMSVISVIGVTDHYDRHKVMRHLGGGEVVVFSAGTGNSLFITDSVVCLHVIEIDVDVVFKAIKVGGVYTTDLLKGPNAEKLERLAYDEVLDRKLGVTDLAAICPCRDQNMPLRVFNMNKPGTLLDIVAGSVEDILIEEG